MKRTIIALAITAVIAIVATAWVRTATHASVVPNPEGHLVFTDDNGHAVSGYDVVEYFGGKATRGTDQFTSTWQGATYQFATAANKAKFDAQPDRFAPQYGGYCAWGVAEKADLFPADPTIFEVVNDKLYLNFNKDIQTKWRVDIPDFIHKGDATWPKLSENQTSK